MTANFTRVFVVKEETHYEYRIEMTTKFLDNADYGGGYCPKQTNTGNGEFKNPATPKQLGEIIIGETLETCGELSNWDEMTIKREKVVKKTLVKQWVFRLSCCITHEEEIFVYKTAKGSHYKRFNMNDEPIEDSDKERWEDAETLVAEMEHDWRLDKDGDQYIFQHDDEKVNIIDEMENYGLYEMEEDEWEEGEPWGHKEL